MLIVEEVWKKKILFSFHNVFCGRQKPIWEMATEKINNKNRTKTVPDTFSGFSS